MGTFTTDDIRRANLRALREQAGSLQGLARRLNRSPSQVSQWLNASIDQKSGKPRQISSASARYIEDALSLPFGWMDVAHDEVSIPGERPAGPTVLAVLSKEEDTIVTMLRKLTPEARKHLISLFEELFDVTPD